MQLFPPVLCDQWDRRLGMPLLSPAGGFSRCLPAAADCARCVLALASEALILPLFLLLLFLARAAAFLGPLPAMLPEDGASVTVVVRSQTC